MSKYPPRSSALHSDQQLDGHIMTPLQRRSTIMRLDVGPFIVVYLILIAFDQPLLSDPLQEAVSKGLSHDKASASFLSICLHHWLDHYHLYQSVMFGIVMLTHAALVVAQQWRVSNKVWVGFRRLKQEDIERQIKKMPGKQLKGWTNCYVEQVNHGQASSAATSSGSTDIVPVVSSVPSSSSNIYIINFQDTIFRAPASSDDDMNSMWPTSRSEKAATKPLFHKLRFPIDLPLSFYQNEWKGYVTLADVTKAANVYGENATLIQLPPFLDLLGEQLLAPFFLFQLFCVLLWSLDEYWYYALFTLFALIMFESTVAFNRLKSLQRLRGTLRHAYHVLCYRHGRWILIMTNELIPGDLVSMKSRAVSLSSRNNGGENTSTAASINHIPADMLLLNGTAVVDEALLTGESIPQLKAPVEDTFREDNPQIATLDLQEHKSSILFGGTILVSQEADGPVDNASPISSSSTRRALFPPDGGVLCMVLRTGFETAQGSLLRSMAHSSLKSGGSNNTTGGGNGSTGLQSGDTYVFVGILLVCAVASAAMVLQEGWGDETRNRFRLLLHVIIIVTSVVPPELPMELSLAVTNSVADLMKRCRVYCTEPFRIPWAGQVDTCCFDKTGTLTSDEMQLRGVRLLSNDTDDSLNKRKTDDIDDDKEALLQGTQKPKADETVPSRPSKSVLLHPLKDELPWETLRVMVGCHALVPSPKPDKDAKNGQSTQSQQELVGNPLEKAVLKDSGYFVRNSTFVVRSDQDDDEDVNGGSHSRLRRPRALMILRRYPFSSRLKRMTVLLTEDSDSTVYAVAKGAPEVIKMFLKSKSIPANYDRVYLEQMGLGRRVLAMAYRKVLPQKIKGKASTQRQWWNEVTRDSVEKELTFGGFLVLDCPLKPDSRPVISELRRSGHDVVMITGDAVLTAAEVARQVGISPKKDSSGYELREKDEDSTKNTSDVLCRYEFVPLETSKNSCAENLTVSKSTLKTLKTMKPDSFFCMSGSTLSTLVHHVTQENPVGSTSGSDRSTAVLLDPNMQRVLQELCQVISVFARHTPHQKEAVVAAFNFGGRHTLMCGDGTNDVGALKRAHVGISIISAPDVEAKHREATTAIEKVKKSNRKSKKKKVKSSKAKMSPAEQSLQESLRALQDAQAELDHVELGDASVASPFTSRAMSIRCCKDVLQQGRCTLVTMLQIYKILGVNCLVNALVLTKLHMHGVKQGDRQLTAMGVVVALLFYFVTRGKPLPALSEKRPPSSVLCTQALVSIAVQFLIHLLFILLATEMALAFVDPYDPSIIPDGAFNPNVLNTCTFLVTVVAVVNTFAVNYRGRPFMEDLRENKMLWRSLQVCYFVLLICASGAFPPLNDLLQLSSFPNTWTASNEMTNANNEQTADAWIQSIRYATGITALVREAGFQSSMVVVLVMDTILVFLSERVIRLMFD